MDDRPREIFEGCLELTTDAAREAFLAEERGSDVHFAQRVRRLLVAHDARAVRPASSGRRVRGRLPAERIGPCWALAASYERSGRVVEPMGRRSRIAL
jgi:hypothetical protein